MPLVCRRAASVTRASDDLGLVLVGDDARVAVPDLQGPPALGAEERQQFAGALDVARGAGLEPAEAAVDVEGVVAGNREAAVEPGEQLVRAGGAEAADDPEETAARVAMARLHRNNKAQEHTGGGGRGPARSGRRDRRP